MNFQFLVLATLIVFSFESNATEKKLRIYIMAGQSNMVGQGDAKTIDYIKDDPKTVDIYNSLVKRDGTPYISERVRISFLNGRIDEVGEEKIGKLKMGYGNSPDNFGPELLFGIIMEQQYDGPILIIKTAWGGNSLCNDYRPPSAGPFPKDKVGKNSDDYTSKTGRRYKQLIAHVKDVLQDPERVHPDYDVTAGYELAGLVWFQAHADYINQDLYPLDMGDSQYAEYTNLLNHIIKDIRKDLDCPTLPFAIGVVGFWGNLTPGAFNSSGDRELKMRRFRKAVEAISQYEEFSDNVATVPTAPFWDDELGKISLKLSPVSQMRLKLRRKAKGSPNEDGTMSLKAREAYLKQMQVDLLSEEEEQLWKRGASSGGEIHYMGSAKFYAQAGKAFAEAMLNLPSHK